MVSFLTSVYPRISYLSLTREYPDAPLESLSAVLKMAGNDTAFFSSGDLSSQRANEFLAHRQFDLVEDYHDRTCSRPLFTSEQWPELDGSDEQCTVDSLIRWIALRRMTPFFAVMWTMQAHYPYFITDPEVDYGVGDPVFNRYLNAVRESDRALGALLRALQSQDLADSTLVVVVGDHGEAFGRHGQYGHGTDVYEENLRVPLVLINGKAFRGEEYARIGGVVDVGPTVFHLLNRPLPNTWQGHSLLDGEGSSRAYFCTPWSDFLYCVNPRLDSVTP